ncbi:protein RRC1-like [Lolium perenne]|uniref:protein RRC1-like n=1 Tax=Lolium perenne TaxID=4522 RepID=UPI003A9A54BE
MMDESDSSGRLPGSFGDIDPQTTNLYVGTLSPKVLYDYELKIGWVKYVALPSQVLPGPPPGHMAIRSKEEMKKKKKIKK